MSATCFEDLDQKDKDVIFTNKPSDSKTPKSQSQKS
jgi:hypothetical protein